MLSNLNIKHLLRPASALLPLLLLPKILGHQHYSEFLKFYYYYLAILTVLLSPIEQSLIITAKRTYYRKVVFFGAMTVIMVTLGILAIYFAFGRGSLFEVECLVAASFFYLNNILKLYKIDTGYYFSDIATQLISIIFLISLGLAPEYYPVILSFSFFVSITIFRRNIFFGQSLSSFLKMSRLYVYVYRNTFTINAIGNFIKNFDSVVVRYIFFDPKAIITYRFVRAAFNSLSYLNSLQIQDYWVGGGGKSNGFFKKSTVIILAIFLLIIIFVYVKYIHSTLTYFEWLLLGTSISFLCFSLSNSKYFIDIYTRKDFKKLQMYSFISLVIYSTVLPFIHYTIYLLLFGIYFAQFSNGFLILRRLKNYV
jgi:hypothetical protein